MDEELAKLVKVVAPEQQDEWEERRKRWNFFSEDVAETRIIAVPKDTEEVVKIVNWALKHNQTNIGARSGGHGFFSTAEVEIDMREGFNYTKVDKEMEETHGYVVATIGMGQTLAQVDERTAPYHAPIGVVSHTGCGLLLTGGVGYQCKARGASADNILEITIVTSDGQIRTCSAEKDPDLFFGVRGAAPNLGVVTEVKMKCFHQPTAFMTLRSWPNTVENLKMLTDWADQDAVLQDNNITPYVFMIPTPDLATHLVGTMIVCIGDDDEKYKNIIGQLEGTPGDTPLVPASRVPWKVPQTCFDTTFGPMYWYITQQHFPGDQKLDPKCLEDMVEAFGNTALNPTLPIIIFEQRGSKSSIYHQVASDSCAQPRFDQRWECFIFFATKEKEHSSKTRDQGRAARDTLLKYATGGGRSHNTRDEPGRLEFYYGENSEKLRTVAAKYDPHRLFAKCNGMEF